MIGTTVAHYRILEQIGAGGMGVVYRARDERLERDVALKFLPAHLSLDEEAKRRFMHEARSASALDHPHICTIHAVDETPEGQLFIAMALYDGETLFERLKRGRLDPGAAVDLALQVADGLQAAHAAGILHRDVKPANVMITRDGQAKIVDFGLAKAAHVDLTRPGTTLGTLAYMSPEQARGATLDARSDVWSLGVVLYELLAGERPFPGETLAVVNAILEDEAPPLAGRAGIPAELAAIVHQTLIKDPERRCASAAELRAALAAWRTPRAVDSGPPTRRRMILALATMLVALLAVSAWQWVRSARASVVRREVLPEIERLVNETSTFGEGSNLWKAFDLALAAEEVVPDDPLLARLWPQIAHPIDLDSAPPDARVFARTYDDEGGAWRPLGTTPIEGLRFPKGFARLRLELAGHVPVESITWNRSLGGVGSDELTFQLHPPGSVPEGMVWVAATEKDLALPGLEGLESEPVGGFWIDRCEVANEEYQRFVDAGGYQRREHWRHTFVLDGRELSFEKALELFRDRTGRTGPATWEVGAFPAGKGRLPVSGVSWYEAAAYAHWAEKELPTIFHWNAVAFTWAAPVILPRANFGGAGPATVDSAHALHLFGVLNLAGNVREWCWNESSRAGQRFILGGGWNDPPYAFNDAYAQRAFDRADTNGFRCIRTDEVAAPLLRVIELPFRDFYSEEPVSDERFEAILAQYAYDRTPLEPVLESERDEGEWTRQRISFDTAYGERMFAYLLLPKRGKPPYQTLVYFPGSNVIHQRSSEELRMNQLEFFLRSGRAVMHPIYAGTYERGGALDTDQPSETVAYRDCVRKWAKDLCRSVDYLETRPEIDMSRLAYWGASWGGRMSPIMLTVEQRFRTAMLFVAGLKFQRALPEADPFHFVSRVHLPVLMLNGEFDFFFPKETSQRPLFELLGTPPEHKRWAVFPGGHSVPQNVLIQETLAWLDRYLGPVEGL